MVIYSERARRSDGLAIASITLWEIATLVARGRIAVRGTVASWTTELLATTGVAVLDVTPTIAELATSRRRAGDGAGCV